MQIALVKPCWGYPISRPDNTYNRRWPPLELLNCAAILEAQGHQVRIVDGQAEGLSPEKIVERVGSPDLVAVTSSALDRWQCPTLEFTPLLSLLEPLRQCTERLVLLGFHGTVQPEAMLHLAGVDAAVRGEPEETLAEIASGRPWDEIAGLTFLRSRQVVSTENRLPIDMSALPIPAMHLIDLKHYNYEILGSRLMVLEGSRGCPYPCHFCSRVIQGTKVRRKNVEQLGREIETAVENHRARSVYFIDLEFTASRDLAEGICRYILDRGIRVRWCCQTRADRIDEPLLRLMKRAGCRLIHFGVETGSDRVAELAGKHITVEQQRRGIRLAKRVGLQTLCFFLLGHPGETDAEMEQTVRLARELNPTYASFHRVSPYAGTPLYESCVEGSTELFPAFAGSAAEQQRVDGLVRQAIWSFYTRPKYVLSRLVKSSPASLWRQWRLFTGYFR